MLGPSSHPLLGGLDTRYLLLHDSSIVPYYYISDFSSVVPCIIFLGSVVLFTEEDHGKMGLCHLVWTGSDLWHSSCSVNLKMHKNCIESQSSGRVYRSKYLGKSPSDSDQEKNYTDKLLLLTHVISKHGIMF